MVYTLGGWPCSLCFALGDAGLSSGGASEVNHLAAIKLMEQVWCAEQAG